MAVRLRPRALAALALFLALPAAAQEACSRDPMRAREPCVGMASWYGSHHHGRRTAGGERFDRNAMTAAHPTLPFGTRVQVTDLATGRVVTVRINDRGPRRRAIDLSEAAARALGIHASGVARVQLTVVE